MAIEQYKKTYVITGRTAVYPVKGHTPQINNPEITGLYLAHPDGFKYDVILSTFLLPRVFNMVKEQIHLKAKTRYPARILDYLDNNEFEVDLTYEQTSQRWAITKTNVRRIRNAKEIDHNPAEPAEEA